MIWSIDSNILFLFFVCFFCLFFCFLIYYCRDWSTLSKEDTWKLCSTSFRILVWMKRSLPLFKVSSFSLSFSFSFLNLLLDLHWNEVTNRRGFFDEFARSNGFDPLEPKNWYSIASTQIFNSKVFLSFSSFFSPFFSLFLFFVIPVPYIMLDYPGFAWSHAPLPRRHRRSTASRIPRYRSRTYPLAIW